MKKLLCLLSLTAIAVPLYSAFAIAKTDLDRQIRNTLERCYTEVKGCRDITDRSAGILVFPDVTKGGLGLAYESGNGALLENGRIVGYYKTSSASVGATIGVGSHSTIIALRTPEELRKFRNSSNWEVGADARIAMLNAGTAGSMDTANIKESVVGIVFGQSGALADISIKGSKISNIDTKDLG